MKNYLTTGLHVIILGHVFCGLYLAQEIEAVSQAPQLRNKDIKLQIETVRAKVTVNETVELKVALKNLFANTVFLPADRFDRFAGFDVSVTDSRGRPIMKINDSLTSNGIGSRMDWEIGPKFEFKVKLLLSDFYDLNPGKYSITVLANIHNAKKRESVLVSSNTVKLIVRK